MGASIICLILGVFALEICILRFPKILNKIKITLGVFLMLILVPTLLNVGFIGEFLLIFYRSGKNLIKFQKLHFVVEFNYCKLLLNVYKKCFKECLQDIWLAFSLHVLNRQLQQPTVRDENTITLLAAITSTSMEDWEQIPQLQITHFRARGESILLSRLYGEQTRPRQHMWKKEGF